MRYLSTQAKDDPHYYIHHEIGYNYRMTNVQAALGVAQMEQLPGFIEKKQVNYDLYQKLFSDCGECRLLSFKEGTNSNKWFYSLQINDKKIHASMKEIIEKLENSNIQTRAVWGLIHQQRPYQEASAYRIVRAIYYSKCILNIPASTNLTKEDIVYVADEIRRILKGLANE
jgi:perosamine synthetase